MKRTLTLLFLFLGLLQAPFFAQSLNANRIGVEPEFVYPTNASDSIVYLIQFENVTFDTLTSLSLTNLLDTKLDTATFEMISSSHPYQVSLSAGGMLTWTFDSLSLPPTTINEPASQGFLSYKIWPQTNFYPGDTIRSQAIVHFDSTSQISTNSVKYYQKRPWCRLDMINPVTCHNGDDAWVHITTRDFGPGLEYSLDSLTWQTSPDFLNVGNGMYRGHARDSLGNYDLSLGIWLPNAQPFQPGIFLSNDTFSTGPWATFQWKLDDVPIPGATEQFFVPWYSGWYSVTVTDTNGCPGTSEDSLYIFVSREEYAPQDGGWIYPNPVQDQLVIEFSHSITPGTTLLLTDLNGKDLHRSVITRPTAKAFLDLRHFPPGLYLVEVRDPHHGTLRSKVIKH